MHLTAAIFHVIFRACKMPAAPENGFFAHIPTISQ